MSQITIATSIAPKDIENQQRTTKSWVNAGFKVVSVNIKQEIKQLQSQFPHVTFHEAKRDARKETGKPLIYIEDILSFFRKQEGKICGIVNSDIHFKTSPKLGTFLNTAAKDAFVFASRVEVKHLEQRLGSILWGGFDMFFFDKRVLDVIPKSKFCLGMPLWDYWLPLIVLTKGVPVRLLTTPLGYHISHEQNWDRKNTVRYAIHFTEFFSNDKDSARQLERLYKTNPDAFFKAVDKIHSDGRHMLYLSGKTQWIAYDMYSDMREDSLETNSR